MTTLLVTGFEPFGGDAANPSGQAARRLHGQWVEGRRVHGVELPCDFARAGAALHDAIVAARPSLVLCLGLASSRRGFTPERVAINWIDARIADNAGAQPVDVPVLPGGPAAHFTTLPVKAMVAALRSAGHEASVSYGAGSFVCNQVFYLLMQALAGPAAGLTGLAGLAGVRGGFMHVGAGLSAADVADAAVLALRAALAAGPDLDLPGGTLD